MQAVAIHGSVNAVLERGAQITQGHARAQQFSLVAQGTWWNPRFWQGSIAQKDREPFAVERVRLVRLAHAFLGFHGIRQVHVMTGSFHLVHQPVPVPGGLNSDLATFGKPAEKLG